MDYVCAIERLKSYAMSPLLRLSLAICSIGVLSIAGDAGSAQQSSARSLDDYKHFRVLAIDLAGRAPTREEVAAFENPKFDTSKWIDQHLTGPAYVERMTRIYMDLLRLEPNLTFSAAPAQLYRTDVLGPDGKPVHIFYRGGQRRKREATDGEFCLSPDETGQVIRPMAAPIGTAINVSKKTLDAYTVLVKPWWLYRDYREKAPTLLFGKGWANPDPDFRPVEALLTEADGKTPTTEVRICREEANVDAVGHIYTSGRTKNPPVPPTPAVVPGSPPPPAPRYIGGRPRPAPLDKPYAIAHKNEAVPCDGKMGLDYAPECGCGVGLERCAPNSGNGDSPAFYFPNHMPLGPGMPLDESKQSALRWYPYWWSREAVHFINYLFDQDRDFREILTGRETVINGPLAQFYKNVQRGNCCGPEVGFGMLEEREPLFEPKNVPADLEPQDASTWKLVPDRGARAAGILTTPMFLEKYASARARGAALYNAFLCKNFNAEKTQLTPSDNPNLMERPGCQQCHATLEPLAAYFTRVEPSSFVFLPAAEFPARNASCVKDKNGHLNGTCNQLYDVAFADNTGAMLRSAYGSPEHADEAPAGAGQDITKSPEFASCAVERVTSSFLGRPTTPDDEALLASLTTEFVKSGYRMRELVKNVVRSSSYQKANNLSSSSWRGGQ